MSRVFPRNFRAIAGRVALGVFLLIAMTTIAMAYYLTPKYTRVGYEPRQPVAFSHQLHAGQLGMDCRHCHSHVGHAPHANMPTAQVCMNCHDQAKGNIKAQSQALAPLREAQQNGRPVGWVRVHKVPDYVYFSHAVHVQRGVGCVSCHGPIDKMAAVWHDQPMSMSWCLDCHRDPAASLRPAMQATNLNWDAAANWDVQKDPLFHATTQEQFARLLQKQSGIEPPTHCTGCHR